MKNKGFTLVELLVVIAIIGILSSVAVINLNSSRETAKRAVVLDVMNQLKPAIILCLNSGKSLTFDMEYHDQEYANYLTGGGIPEGLLKIPLCTDSEIYWPIFFENGWHYKDYNSDYSAMRWEIQIANTPENELIVCSEAGCSYQ